MTHVFPMLQLYRERGTMTHHGLSHHLLDPVPILITSLLIPKPVKNTPIAFKTKSGKLNTQIGLPQKLTHMPLTKIGISKNAALLILITPIGLKVMLIIPIGLQLK